MPDEGTRLGLAGHGRLRSCGQLTHAWDRKEKVGWLVDSVPTTPGGFALWIPADSETTSISASSSGGRISIGPF